jgi:hypothetical protein
MQGRFFVFSPRMKKIAVDDLSRQCPCIGIGLRISVGPKTDTITYGVLLPWRPDHTTVMSLVAGLGRTNPNWFLGGKSLGIQQGTSV